jgi:misacylated tRNA(Ala) deacylase
MTRQIAIVDAYRKECDAKVISAEGALVELDQTVIFPTGGGYPSDTGTISWKGADGSGAIAKITEATKKEGKVFHKLDAALGALPPAGDSVRVTLDWERRHKLIRMHTSAHMLGALMYKRGAQVTGNQLGVEQTRFDFNCPTGLQREMFDEAAAELNDILKGSAGLKIYELPREEALKIGGISKFASGMLQSFAVLRIVEIPGIDIQADGGPHVKNINEIGQLKIEKVENKGAQNKRLYYSLLPPACAATSRR